jgi:hypothetical protein
MRWLAISMLGLVSLTQAAEARACSCMALSPAEGLSSSHAVFTGEVTAITKNEATRFGGIEVTLRVGKVWKGAPTEEIRVHTASSSAACGYPFVVGKTYLVYAVRDEADPMRVSLCSRTALIEDAAEDLDFLGKPSHVFGEPEVGAKTKRGESDRKDNCAAAPGGVDASRFGWVALLLAATVLTLRRVI